MSPNPSETSKVVKKKIEETKKARVTMQKHVDSEIVQNLLDKVNVKVLAFGYVDGINKIKRKKKLSLIASFNILNI